MPQNGWTEPKMYVQVLGLFLYLTIYGMLFDMCTLLYNPFGAREIDINHFTVGKGIRKLAQELSKGSVPQTMNCAIQHDDIWISDSNYEMSELSIAKRVSFPQRSSVSVMTTGIMENRGKLTGDRRISV